MNEAKKTGVFWAVAAVTLAIGLFLAWPTTNDQDEKIAMGTSLFEEFKDPSAASSLKMVTFDEEQGQVATFEVRRDPESGVWSIPSRSGYPADAVEQMKNAANALVGLQILDVQTRAVEDHEALGVVEPKLEDLEVGDVGVGRLVTFKDQAQKTLASLVIGNPVKGEEGKVYVRRPGQDPVYVVKLDEATLSTKFDDWIEKDLLQMSSIDIKELTIKDYTTAMGPRGGVSLNRNYTAELEMENSTWKLARLLQYAPDNPVAEPTEVQVGDDQVLNKDKLNDIKNALDDLKIADVARKPDGMSANLRADKELVSDNEALMSLASRGFFPVSMGADGEAEVLSANGELTVTIRDGVEYVLRFGNVSGLSDDEDNGDGSGDAEPSVGGVNRYLLVTARVDETQFPAPDLRPVPQSIQELEAMLGLDEKMTPDDVPADMKPETTKPETTKPETTEPETTEPTMAETTSQEAAVEESATEEKAETITEKPAEPQPTKSETSETPTKPEATDKPEATKKLETTEKLETSEKPAVPPKTELSDPIDVSGGGEATGDGQGQVVDEAADSAETDDVVLEPAADDPAAAQPSAAQPAAVADDGELTWAELSEEEKMERLEAEQEKVLKENTRMLDQRKDRLNAAKQRVAELNARFADWYYVIPESTYGELRISRDELLTAATDEPGNAPLPPAGLPPGFGN